MSIALIKDVEKTIVIPPIRRFRAKDIKVTKDLAKIATRIMRWYDINQNGMISSMSRDEERMTMNVNNLSKKLARLAGAIRSHNKHHIGLMAYEALQILPKIRELANTVDPGLRQRAQAAGAGTPGLQQVINSLHHLAVEFKGLMMHDGHIMVVTPNDICISYEDGSYYTNMGKYILKFPIRFFGANSCIDRVLCHALPGQENEAQRMDISYPHPHVSDINTFCFGTATGPVEASIQRADPHTLFNSCLAVLTHYNDASPFRQLNRWGAERGNVHSNEDEDEGYSFCEDCAGRCETDEMNWVGDYLYCIDCSHWCEYSDTMCRHSDCAWSNIHNVYLDLDDVHTVEVYRRNEQGNWVSEYWYNDEPDPPSPWMRYAVRRRIQEAEETAMREQIAIDAAGATATNTPF